MRVYSVRDIDNERVETYFRTQVEAMREANKLAADCDHPIEVFLVEAAPLNADLLIRLLNNEGGWAACDPILIATIARSETKNQASDEYAKLPMRDLRAATMTILRIEGPAYSINTWDREQCLYAIRRELKRAEGRP